MDDTSLKTQTQTDDSKIGQPQSSPRSKEAIESFSGNTTSETALESVDKFVETIPTSIEVEKNPELKGFVEELPSAEDLIGGVTADYTERVLVGNSTSSSGKVPVLPLTENQVKEGLHHQVFESIRWMAEWCVRQIKILHGKVMYKPEESK